MSSDSDSLGDYRLLQRLGGGAAGDVFLATPLVAKSFAAPGDPVAIKRYKPAIFDRPNQIERVRREFAAGEGVAHPNLVRMLELSLEQQPFLVMEYIAGVSLLEWIEMFHPASPWLIFRFIDQIATALHALHSAGVIHRDVKPSNIVISADFNARLMDLGVVRFEEKPKISDSAEFVGTKRNAAPEFLTGHSYDARADIYSLGTVLFCLLHGEEVFADERNSARLVQRVCNEQPAFDDELQRKGRPLKDLFDLMKTLLAKEPSGRPSTISDVISLLDSMREDFRSPAEPLHAYVATALTSVAGADRDKIDFPSKWIADTAKEFDIYVYQPRYVSDPL
jgi:serine/threonine protein kinase